MSSERRRAREARQQARLTELATAAERRARQEHRAAVKQRLKPSLRRRRRRYGALSTRARAELVAIFLAVQVVAWLLLPGVGTQFVIAVLTIACLAVLVRTRKRSPR